MSKSVRSGYIKSVEAWTVGPVNARTTVLKVAVRSSNGQFHGATNFRTKPQTGRRKPLV